MPPKYSELNISEIPLGVGRKTFKLLDFKVLAVT